MAHQLTREEILQSLRKDGVSVDESNKSGSLLEIAGNAAEKYINKPIENAGLPNLAAGILSAPPKLAKNVINFPGDVLNQTAGTHVPKVGLPDWLNPSSASTLGHSPTQNAMGSLGDLIGDLMAGGKLFNTAGKALGMKATTPLLKRAALGAGAGAALSDSDQFGGRTLGAVIGGSAPLISGVTKSTIGKRAAEIYSENKGKYGALYNKILEEAEKMPIDNKLPVPKKLLDKTEDVKDFFRNSNYKLKGGVQRFESNPTIQNAHQAQSDLGKIIRDFDVKIKAGKQLSSGEQNAQKAAKDLQKRIRGMMQQHFAKGGREDLAKQYAQTAEGYAKDVAPLKSKSMAKYNAGEGSAKSIGKELLANSKFAESKLAKQLPGYGVKKAIHDVPLWAKTMGATAVVPTLSMMGVPIPYHIRKLLGG